MRWVEHKDGGYWDYCDFPLKDATDEMFDEFPEPDADDFDYDSAYLNALKMADRYALFVGSPGTLDILNSNGRIMGVEDLLVNLALKNEAALRFIKRRAEFQLKMLERLIDKCKDLLTVVWLGEDLGTRIGPMISLELYREQLLPYHKAFVDMAKSYGLYVLMHTCGSSSWVYEDFIRIGVNGVDTLQPRRST